jgi:pSer/pThr/pTyr-binding forkhead associated (FHA) protein
MRGCFRTNPDDTGRWHGWEVEIGNPQEEARDRFIVDLRRLREEAGQPSLGQLVKLSGHKFSKSTLDDHLSGRRSRLPSWRFVAAFVEACHAAADSTGLDVSQLGTIDEWRTRWLKAFRDPSRQASRPLQSSAKTQKLDAEKVRQMLSRPPVLVNDLEDPEYHPRASTGPFLTLIGERELLELSDMQNNIGVLVIINDIPSTQEQFTLDDDLVVIGRGEDSDIRLYDISVSRRHAIIRRDGIRFSIRDVGSINGTYLDHRRITAETRLKSRQELQIGIYRLLFIQGKRKVIPGSK